MSRIRLPLLGEDVAVWAAEVNRVLDRIELFDWPDGGAIPYRGKAIPEGWIQVPNDERPAEIIEGWQWIKKGVAIDE